METTPDQERRGLTLALAASAGAHVGLVPAHAAESPLVGALFGGSALALAGLAVLVDRRASRAIAPAALLLIALLTLYLASRMVVVWPLAHVEAVDAVGVITKLFEAAGLGLALSLLQESRGGGEPLPALREGAGP